jgi:hypothetical protein
LAVSITTSGTQPALVGGLVMGVLSALPLVAAANLCCCLWVISGGVVAAYVLQQNQPAAITANDGAIVGLMAGLVGAVVYLIVSIPVTIIVTPFERALVERLLRNTGREFPAAMGTFGIAFRIIVGFVFMLCAGAIFSTLGGLLGVAIFKRHPPGPIDIPSAS